MTSSWEENPSERTQFTDIARKLKSCLGKVYEVGILFLSSFAKVNCFLTDFLTDRVSNGCWCARNSG